MDVKWRGYEKEYKGFLLYSNGKWQLRKDAQGEQENQDLVKHVEKRAWKNPKKDGDALMDTSLMIQLIIAGINLLFVILTLISVILIYKTMKVNQNLNRKVIFNEVVKQERELRVKLTEYRKEIHNRIKKGDKKEDLMEVSLDYDTLLFNYYEYLAVCIYKGLVNEDEIKLYFKDLLKEVKEKFDHSILFEEGYSEREQYRGLIWLFKKWTD